VRNYISQIVAVLPQAMMIGRILNDGRLTGRIKYDVNESASLKLQTQLTQEKGYSQMMVDLDVKVCQTICILFRSSNIKLHC
jgi:DsbC/DsbD-like thiol-disulfide interchange protein